jgi:predicted transcriptional regulator
MKTYRIAQARQKAVLASAVRQNLLDTLCAARLASVPQLAAQMGMRVSALYYHLHLLERAGLVTRQPSPRGGPRREACFSARATKLVLDHDLGSTSGRRASERVVQALLRAAARDFAAGARSPLARVGTATQNLWASRVKAWLTDRDIAAVREHLRAIDTLMLGSRRAPGTTLCAVSWVLAPVAADVDRAAGRRATPRRRP